jgi:hypothetical protein
VPIKYEGIKIKVGFAFDNNPNKSMPAPAVELWAVTTFYETTGHDMERVQLFDNGGGVFEALLEIDNKLKPDPRTVIVFDDVFDIPNPYIGKGQVGDFCSCSRSVNFAFYANTTMSYVQATSLVYFTDTNFGEPGGACGIRIP